MKLTIKQNIFLDGNGFTATEGVLVANGEETKIAVVQFTNGRSGGYEYTSRKLVCGDHELDLLENDGPDVENWVRERLEPDHD